uniref:hypothetical protein n=1 Tax=Streptomyces sp. rh155 TaxID=3028728 RepID=UPI001EFC8019
MTGDLNPSPVAVTLTSGPAGPGSIDDFELFYARRALHRFRARLGRQGLLDLLAADIEEGNALLRESARASDGTFQGGHDGPDGTGPLVGRVPGLDGQGLRSRRERTARRAPRALRDGPRGRRIVPRGGEHRPPRLFLLHGGGWGTDAMAWAADAEELLPEPEFPHKMSSNLFLADGTVVGRALTQFGDTAEGFTASLTVHVPAACPQDVLEHHLRHYAVEFRNWILAAATSVRAR